MCKELLEFPWNKYKKEWCHYNYYSMLGFGNWCFLKSNLIDLQELEREQIELSTLENILCDTNLNRVTNKVAFNHLLRHINMLDPLSIQFNTIQELAGIVSSTSPDLYWAILTACMKNNVQPFYRSILVSRQLYLQPCFQKHNFKIFINHFYSLGCVWLICVIYIAQLIPQKHYEFCSTC